MRATRPWIAPRYLSLFACSRPPLPWDHADLVSQTLRGFDVHSVGVTGSVGPSVLTSLGYGAEHRAVNAFAFQSCWDEGIGWNYVVEDSPGMEEDHPWASPHLPVEVNLWDSATPVFESDALFVDLPLTHPAVRLRRESLDKRPHQVVMLGFLEGYAGPDDVLDWARQQPFEIAEHHATSHNAEGGQRLDYCLVIATQTPEVARRTARERARWRSAGRFSR